MEYGWPEDTFFGYDEHRRTRGRTRALTQAEANTLGYTMAAAVMTVRKLRRRRVSKAYAYKSGSTYHGPSLIWGDDAELPRRFGQLRAVHAPTTDLLPTATLKIQNQWKQVKLDTAAQYCVAGDKWKSFGRKLNGPIPVEGFREAAVRVLRVWRFEFRTQYLQSMRVDALIVEHDIEDFLIGEDWMYDTGVKTDFVSGEMKWYSGDVKMAVPFMGIGTHQQQTARTGKVRLLRKAKVRTQIVHNVEVAVPVPDGSVGLFVPKTRKEAHATVAPTLVTVPGGKATVPILNSVGRTTKLPSCEALETVSTWLEEIGLSTSPLSNEEELEIGDMGADDKLVLLKLLRIYPTLLEPKTGCPQATTMGVVHDINTGSEAPIKIRPRRHSRAENETIDAEVRQMLRDGDIEEGTGAWGFPVVLVKKKDGSVRFCVDYQMLNNITKKAVYPLPRIDEAKESMHGSRRFTSLDLHAGYWQVPVAENDKDKTGFVTRQGLFRFVGMPFGLAYAPGTFQHMMGTELRGLTWKIGLVYLDDVMIFSGGEVARHGCRLCAALMQDHGNGDQPVAYASKVNSPTVAKYGITDLECAVVIWAVRLFRPYLYGQRFEFVTDHSALTYLMRSKDLTGRLHRWALQLQENDFVIHYRAGSTNTVADALSRAPVRVLATVRRSEESASSDMTQPMSEVESAVAAGDEELAAQSAARIAGRASIGKGDPETGQLTDAEIQERQQEDKVPGIGDVRYHWALDVAGPLPVIANHTATDTAKFLLERVVVVFGPPCELVMDGAPELNGEVVKKLVQT
ncbi:unnamed protein product [Phytophthora fragariaefolia]|uniref:RNA-directed DNA polymerase n=1 Tax=Phytophthora fragariaefolia TaxID=1490495 RepID=A0A9W6YAT4_9STRA|nr:unnamed protein product [Phytophthora fragariaefolia]